MHAADMPETGDAFGLALMDWVGGASEPDVIEREDGVRDLSAGREFYLAEFPDWPAPERAAMRYVRGRVVDVGCGAGRVAIHLQQRGFEAVGVDVSALAVRAAKKRGLERAWCMPIEELSTRIGEFDTALLFGNNFGIFGTPGELRASLGTWALRMPPDARILAESTNPYCGDAPAMDRSYYHENRRRGRLPGQMRLRNIYRETVSEWFDWLFVSRKEMATLLRGTGWHVHTVLSEGSGEAYVAVLEKDRVKGGG